MDTIEIRLAKKEDAQFIALLGRTTFTETFGHLFRDQKDLIDYYNLTFSVQKIEDGMKKQNNIFWIAFVNRLPVGYAKLKLHSCSEFIESKDVCQLQKIYVLKDFLSMRIGFELQDSLLKKAKELGFNKVWLSVLNSNERAINFYKKPGLKKSVITIFKSEKKISNLLQCSKPWHKAAENVPMQLPSVSFSRVGTHCIPFHTEGVQRV